MRSKQRKKMKRGKTRIPFFSHMSVVIPVFSWAHLNYIQLNLDNSNTDGSYTVEYSNSFFSPYEILPIAQENKYLGNFSYFIMKLYNECCVYSLESPHRYHICIEDQRLS